MEYKTLIDDYFRKVPEYYPEMYQDGFTPEEIISIMLRIIWSVTKIQLSNATV